MPSRQSKFLASIVSLAFIASAAVPADAAGARKTKKKPAAAAAAIVPAPPDRYRNDSLFPPGPVYFGTDYLGYDPDPFIRSQILRDLGARYGGEP